MAKHPPVTVEAEDNLVPRNGMLPIALNVEVPDEYRNLNNGIQVRPAIKDTKSDKVLVLEPMVIEGKLNSRFNERMNIYQPAEGDSISYRIPYQKKNPIYRYETQVPYEAWFSTSKIEVDLTAEAYNRRLPLGGNKVDQEFTDYATGIDTKVFEKYYFWSKPEQVRTVRSGVDEGSSATVTFPIASADMGNHQGKEELESYFEVILHDTEVESYSIEVTIANSPEGSLKTNMDLSQTRKAAIDAYLESLGIDLKRVSYEIIDENWHGLATELANPALGYNEEILVAIDSIEDVDVRENYIRDTYYRDWRRFRKEIYPKLRIADIKVTTVFKGKEDFYMSDDSFSFEEDPLDKAYENHQNLLDAVKNKDYALAAQYADQIPNNGVPDIVLSNKATVYLMEGRLEDARVLLERITDVGDSKINLGLIYLKQEKYAEAEEILDGTICINAAVAQMYAGDNQAATDILNQLPASEKKTILIDYLNSIQK